MEGPVLGTELQDVQRILVVAYGHTADTLPAGPCLAALRNAYSDANIELLVLTDVAEFWSSCPHIDGIRVMRDFRHKGTRFARVEQLWAMTLLGLRLRGKYDLVLVLHAGSWPFSYLAYVTGARYRAGLRGRFPARWLTHAPEPAGGTISFREENRQVLASIGVPVRDPHLSYWPTVSAKIEVDRVMPHGSRPVVALHPGSHWACQRWHNERWATVADAIVERYGAQIVITGSADEVALADDIAAHMRHFPVIAAGRTSLPAFFDLVARCDLMVCVNSAASQVALATGTPVVNLVGLESLAWTAPEVGEPMTVVRESTEPPGPWCPLGIWGRVSGCQIEDHVALAGLDPILPVHVLRAISDYLEPAGAQHQWSSDRMGAG